MARGRVRKARTRAAGVARRAAGRVKRNYGRSRSGQGLMADLKQGMFAFGGGAAYPLAMNLLMKFVPANADGAPSLPRPLIGAAAAIGEHILGRMFLGTRDVGMGAIGAFAADLNLPARFGLNDAAGIKDYLGTHGTMEDYISGRSVGAGKETIYLGRPRAVGDIADVEDIGRRHRGSTVHYARHRLNDGIAEMVC